MDYDAENPAYEGMHGDYIPFPADYAHPWKLRHANEDIVVVDDMRGYDRDRSRSPRPGNGDMRARSASPGPRDRDMRSVMLYLYAALFLFC